MIKKLFKKSLKKTICLVMILSLVAVSGLSLNSALAAGYPYNVVFKGSSGDVNIAFNADNEPIGGTDNRGEPDKTGRGPGAAYFIGWSDVSNYHANKDAKFYYKYEPVSRLVDDNVSTLYPVYFSSSSATNFSKNKAYINFGMTDAETVPGSRINGTVDNNANDHNINLYYDETQNTYDIKLESSFELSKGIAHWLYTGNGFSIMTNTQRDKGSSAKGAKYTHVDLNVTIPDRSGKDVENEKMKMVSNTNLTISKAKALELFKAKRSANITGTVDGYVKMPEYPWYLGGDYSRPIPEINVSSPVSINYTFSSVKFDKNSAALGDTGAQDLGRSNVAYNGSLKGDSLNDGIKPALGTDGDTIADNPAAFVSNGYTYTFKEWNTRADGNGTKFDEDTLVTDPITVYAIYNKTSNGSGGGGGGGGETPTPTPDPRIPGDDRVETAINISKSEYPSADTVIVVRKDLFPDSMTATVLSKQLNAPILLTGSNKLDERVKAEIKRLGAKDVIIVGGVNSVSAGVQNELKAFDKDTVERIAGLDRYGTSVAVANRVVGISGLTHKAVIASGEVFPDALAVSPFAAKNAYPILLVKKNLVPTEVNNAFAKLSIKETYLVGGEDTISKSTEGKLPKVLERMAGKNRYETSVQIAKAKFPQSERAYMASGEVFADALVIGPVGAKYNAPILLTPSKNASKPVADYIKASKISKLIAVGGERYVPKKVMSVYNSNIN